MKMSFQFVFFVFQGMSTFIPKSYLIKNSSCTIQPIDSGDKGVHAFPHECLSRSEHDSMNEVRTHLLGCHSSAY